ncbi:MAG: hypothetical protein QGI33_04660 [Candidatus Brocadiia bacterium]|nr:hypothetical protein [Candidatus Brocadiia bacterium]
MPGDKRDLARRLKDTAYKEGEFTLRSGRKSHYIVDKYAFETRPDLLREIARELAALLRADGFSSIAEAVAAEPAAA